MLVTSSHVTRKIIKRIGSGIEPEELVMRAWNSKRPVPRHWYFPRMRGCVYFRYGDIVFVFGSSWDGTRINCVTVFGPFQPDGSWWEPNIFKRF